MGAPSHPETGKKSLSRLGKETPVSLGGMPEPKENSIHYQQGTNKALRPETQCTCTVQEGLMWGCEGGTDLDCTKDLKSITLENSL